MTCVNVGSSSDDADGAGETRAAGEVISARVVGSTSAISLKPLQEDEGETGTKEVLAERGFGVPIGNSLTGALCTSFGSSLFSSDKITSEKMSSIFSNELMCSSSNVSRGMWDGSTIEFMVEDNVVQWLPSLIEYILWEENFASKIETRSFGLVFNGTYHSTIRYEYQAKRDTTT